MHWTNIGLILVAGLDLGMALFIWLRNPRNKINVSFGLAIFFLALWTFITVLVRQSTILRDGVLWVRILNLDALFLVISFLLFTFYFPHQEKLISLKAKLIIMLLAVISTTIIFSNYFISVDDIIVNPPNTIYYFDYGYAIYVFCILFYLSWAYCNLFKKLKKSQGYAQKQLQYIIIATGGISFFGTLFSAIIPIFFDARFFWYSPYFALPMIIFLIYFIFYYQVR